MTDPFVSPSYKSVSGLRRIQHCDVDADTGNPYDNCSAYQDEISSLRSVGTDVEGQRQHLLGICDNIHVQVKGVLERIGKIVRYIESDSGYAWDLMSEYQQKVWPILIEVDSQIKVLSQIVRQAIDSCKISEGRLEWSLAIHKFQISVEQIINLLTGEISADIEGVLSLKLRVRRGGLLGLRLRKYTVERVLQMQKDMRAKTYQV